MEIRETTPFDNHDIHTVETVAFGSDKEAELTHNLLNDPTALPLLSLLAFEDGAAVGHILFTHARLDGADGIASMLLAPLAVIPEAQNQGVGGALIEAGHHLLAGRGIDLSFVLGHPGYYPRHGYIVAGERGFETPRPILPEDAGAWMVYELTPGTIGRARGHVSVADALMRPEYWRE